MLGNDVASVLPAMRQQAESMMTLILQAYSPGMGTVDGLEAIIDQPEGQTFGRVRGMGNRGRNDRASIITIAGVDHPIVEEGLHIPISAPMPVASPDPKKAWSYVVVGIADGAPDDPNLLGHRYMVVGSTAKSYETSRRLNVIEL